VYGGKMSLSKSLLEVLVCPKCKREVYISKDESYLVCTHCKLKYPIREDIPVMLIEEAETMSL